MGTEDEIQGVTVQYLPNGLAVALVQTTRAQPVVFQIAWRTLRDTKEEALYTWYAADPTL